MVTSYKGSVTALDERRAAGTQHWEVNMDVLLYANAGYFLTLVVLYFWMKDRDAYNPRRFMQFYNLSCVVLAGISGVCIALYKYNHVGGKFVCNERGSQLNDTAGEPTIILPYSGSTHRDWLRCRRQMASCSGASGSSTTR